MIYCLNNIIFYVFIALYTLCIDQSYFFEKLFVNKNWLFIKIKNRVVKARFFILMIK